jgi:hypothetical protein
MTPKLEPGWNESLVEQRVRQGSEYQSFLEGLTDDQARTIHKSLGWAIYSNFFQHDGLSAGECKRLESIAIALWEELEMIFGEGT